MAVMGSLGDAVLQVGQDPVLDAPEGAATVGHSHPGAGAVQGKGRLHGRALAAHDEDVPVEVGVALLEIVEDLGQFLARHADPVGAVEGAGGQDDLPRPVAPLALSLRNGLDHEVTVLARDAG